MDYGALKTLHVTLAMLVGLLLILRLILAARGINYRSVGMLRWFPHVIDTAVLLTAFVLAWWSGQYPFVEAWLTAKVLLLPTYIITAALALNPDNSPGVRVSSAITSCLLLLSIAVVAITHQAFLW